MNNKQRITAVSFLSYFVMSGMLAPIGIISSPLAEHFGNLSLLKVVLSFATQMVRRPTARLVSSLLLGATMGTAVSPWVTSRIVVATDNHFILQFSTACYVTLTVLLIAATQFSSYRDHIEHK